MRTKPKQMRAKPKQISAKQVKVAQELNKDLDCLSSSIGTNFKLLASQVDHELLEIIIKDFDQYFDKQKSLSTIIIDAEPTKDSSNSHEPPSSDKGRPAPTANPAKDKRKIGGQKGHKGTVIQQFENPDKKVDLTPNREKYENDSNWRKVKTIKRQVVDVKFSREVIEYFTDVYENVITGEKVSGEFPEGIEAPLQYGPEINCTVIELKEEQHLPYERIAEFVNNKFGINIAQSTLVNIIKNAENSPVLDAFEEAAVKDILESPCINGDETSVKVKGKKWWVHLLTSPLFILFYCYNHRGKEGMNAMGLLEQYNGIVVHDCWLAYFSFTNIIHALCNAHILRELHLAVEMEQDWAALMSELLLDLNVLVKCHGGVLPLALQDWAREEYRKIIRDGIMATGGEFLARPPGEQPKQGKPAKPKYRNLLERLRDFEDAVLRFMTSPDVPFSNNDAERPVRMLKVHMKISGCFRDIRYAQGFCRMRGYLVTCKKHGIKAGDAIRMLYHGQVPEFITERLSRESTAQNSKEAA